MSDSINKLFDTIFDVIDAGFSDGSWRPPAPKEATDAGPGTKSKVEVLAARVEAGEDLWHDEDRTDFSGTEQKPLVRETRPRAKLKESVPRMNHRRSCSTNGGG